MIELRVVRSLLGEMRGILIRVESCKEFVRRIVRYVRSLLGECEVF